MPEPAARGWTLQHYALRPVRGWYPLRACRSAGACRSHARGALHRPGDRFRILTPAGEPYAEGRVVEMCGWNKTVWTPAAPAADPSGLPSHA